MRWEYKRLDWRFEDFKDITAEDEADMLAEYGADEWELVHILREPEANLYYFKRGINAPESAGLS